MNRHTVVKVVLALAVATPALALGAVHSSVLGVYLVPAAILFGLLAMEVRDGASVRLDLPAAILLGMAVFTGLQLLPLPAAVVELLSPETHEIRARALEPLSEGAPSFMALTLDGPLTLVELAKLFFYLAVYLTCVTWTRREGSGAILKMVVAAGTAAAFVLLAHKILMLDAIYGFYEPLHLGPRDERISAPLINENHMAALLSLSTAVAIGMAISAEDRSRRILLTLIAALIGGCVLLTLSRGGIAAFVGGQLVFLVLRLVHRVLNRRKDEESRRQLAWLPLGLALSLGLGLFVAYDAVLGEFLVGDHKKVEMLSEGLPLVADFPVTGVGRGAFWVAFSLVSDWAANITFTHAENVVVQILVDYGPVVGAAVLMGFAIIMIRRLVGRQGSAKTAALTAALVAFGLHNLVDFNIEIPGVAVVAVAILGALEGNGRREGRRLSSRRERRIPAVLLVGFAAASVALALGTGLYTSAHNVDTEERSLRAALARGDAEAFAPQNMREVIRRHPAAWYIPFLAGVRESRLSGGDPLPWFARSLELNPWSAPTHFHIAEALLRSGYVDQAVLEFRVAVRARPSMAARAATDLVASGRTFTQITKGVWPDSDKRLMWEHLATAFSVAGKEEEARIADEAVLGLEKPGARSLARHARRLAREGRFEDALAAAKKMGKIEKMAAAAAVLEGQVLRAMDDQEGELEVLERAAARWTTDRNLLVNLAWAHQRSGDHKGAMKVAERLRTSSFDARSRAAAIVLEGDLERSEGRHRAALASYRQAFAQVPSDVGLLEKIANLAEEKSDPAVALEALRRLVNLAPKDPEWARRLEALEERIQGGGKAGGAIRY